MERSQRRVGILDLASRDSPSGVGSTLGGAVRVGVDSLPHGEETVNVHVVKPEAGVESGGGKVSHVASRGTARSRAAKSRVDSVVDALERVRASGGAGTGVVVGEASVAPASAEKLVNLVLERSTNVAESIGGALGGAASGVGVAVGIAQGDLPVNERSVDQIPGVLEVVTEKRVDDGLHASRGLDGDVFVAHDVGQDGVSRLRVCRPVPERETHGRGGAGHPSATVGRVFIREVIDDLHELLFEKSEVGAVPRREEYRVVRAVAVRPAAAAALADIVPVLARHAVNAGDLVVGHPVVLAHLLESLKTENEESPLVGLVPEHLSDFQTRVDGILVDTGDGHEASRLPLLEDVGLLDHILDITDVKVGVFAMVRMGDGRRSERQGKEKRRELHNCG